MSSKQTEKKEEENKTITRNQDGDNGGQDYASKARERQRRLTSMMTTSNDSSEPAKKPTKTTPPLGADPTALKDLEAKVAAKNRHAVAGTASIASRLEAKLNDRRGLVQNLLEQGTQEQQQQNLTTTLQAQEKDILATQRLPSETMEEDSTPESTNATSDQIIAHLVDEDDERKQVKKQAEIELLSNAVVASEVTEDDKRNRGPIVFGCCLVLFVGVVLAGVCGSGNCATRQTNTSIDPMERAQEMVRVVNAATLRDVPYPLNGTTATTGDDGDDDAGVQALEYLIETDVLQLNPYLDAIQIVQRYALLNFWFQNGPWTASAADGTEENSAQWLSQQQECDWSGLTCNTDGIVTDMKLEDKDIQGTLPVDMGLLTSLTALSLSFNWIGGPIPPFFQQLGKLRHVNLSFNRLTGSAFPTFLGGLSSLRDWHVKKNLLNGTIPVTLAEATQLETLGLEDNALSGTIPDFLSNLTSLSFLGIRGNDFTGTFPDILPMQLSDLRSLNFGGLQFSRKMDPLRPLSSLEKLTSLQLSSVNLGGVSFQEEMGEWWPNMEDLSFIDASVTGPIPASLAVLWPNLRVFNAFLNDLTGPIPVELFSAWTNIEYFNIRSNNLSGTIPTLLGLWTNLKIFDIRNNNIMGTLPTKIGLLENVKAFYATSNRLSGKIPIEILGMGGVDGPPIVWLDGNNFTGVAPFCDGSGLLRSERVDCLLVQCSCCLVCN